MKIDLSFGAKETVEIPLTGIVRALCIAFAMIAATGAAAVGCSSAVNEIALSPENVA